MAASLAHRPFSHADRIRERELFRYYRPDDGRDHGNQTLLPGESSRELRSPDNHLTALCQLAALRLDVKRASIRYESPVGAFACFRLTATALSTGKHTIRSQSPRGTSTSSIMANLNSRERNYGSEVEQWIRTPHFAMLVGPEGCITYCNVP
jgi:hypothetical protein